MTCQHINNENQRDCENEAEYACECCNTPVCDDHREKDCPYGGEPFVRLEEE